LPRRDGKGGVLHDEGHIYPDMQTIVTYEYAIGAWKGPKPSFDASRLPRTLEMLQKKKPLTIALLGDSISTGCNASAWLKIAPFQPAWQDLLVKNLETVYGSKIVLKNFAVGGTVSEWGLQNIGKVVDVKPDLVILAFGMNDAGSVPGAKYQANIRGMIDAVRKAQPQAEFILVATMRGNPDWAVQDLFPVYRDALAELCKPGIALADMTSIWTELLKHKKYVDITGNGVNHPNDFSHRIYAQVLSCLLIPGDLQATSK
jgi:lysophospholipase L1-like esterase